MKRYNIDEEYFWYKMDMPMTNNMIKMAGFSKEEMDLIWTVERKPFEVFN